MLKDAQKCSLGVGRWKLKEQGYQIARNSFSQSQKDHTCNEIGAKVHIFCCPILEVDEEVQLWEATGCQLFGVNRHAFWEATGQVRATTQFWKWFRKGLWTVCYTRRWNLASNGNGSYDHQYCSSRYFKRVLRFNCSWGSPGTSEKRSCC